MLKECISAREKRGAILAVITACASVIIACLVMIAAAINGLKLGLMLEPAAYTAAWMSSLCWVCWRHRSPAGDPRLARSAAVILLIFTGGAFGRLTCLVGQTFALTLVDQQLHHADLALGLDVNSIVWAAASVPKLPSLLRVAYSMPAPIILMSALLFVWTGRSERAWELCFVFNLCLLVTAVSSIFLPAAGPFYHLHFSDALRELLPAGSGIYAVEPLFALRKATAFNIDPTGLFGVACFPSFHTMMALIAATAWRDIPKLGTVMVVWQALAIVSTIPIGGHYLIDLAGGFVCWAAVQLLWQRSLAKDERHFNRSIAPMAQP